MGMADLWESSAYHLAWASGDMKFLLGLVDLDDIRGDVVGISTTLTARPFALKLAEEIRRRYPSKKIILGGHAMHFETDVLGISTNDVDAICKGEGEHTIRDVLDREFKNLSDVPGLYLPDGDTWRLTSDRKLIPDLDDVPWPSFDEVDVSAYPVQDLPLMGSRGCIARCIFCNDRIRTPKFRTRSAIHQVEELQYLKERYDTNFFIYNDPLMNANLQVVEEKADEIIRRGLQLKYGGNMMVRHQMSKELFTKLRKSGMTVLIAGVESGSNHTLKGMKKMFSCEQASDFLKKAHNAGMRVELNLIVGFPTETEEHFKETLDFLSENRDNIDIIVSAATFNVAYSDLWHQLEEFNIVTYKTNVHNTWHTRDMSNTIETRIDRLHRLIDHAANLGIMNFRTDIEIEEGSTPDIGKFLSAYSIYWKNKEDCTSYEHAETLTKVRKMKWKALLSKPVHVLDQMLLRALPVPRRHKVTKLLDRVGLLEQAIRVRNRIRHGM